MTKILQNGKEVDAIVIIRELQAKCKRQRNQIKSLERELDDIKGWDHTSSLGDHKVKALKDLFNIKD